MHYSFDTERVDRAKAALLLYAMYRSRSTNSPLSGTETWDRVNAYIRGACLKSHTTAGFVQEFCRKAKVASIKPRYLSTGEPVLMPDTGELIESSGAKDYQASLIEDDSLLTIYREESILLITLVRERLQREKLAYSDGKEGIEDEDED